MLRPSMWLEQLIVGLLLIRHLSMRRSVPIDVAHQRNENDRSNSHLCPSVLFIHSN